MPPGFALLRSHHSLVLIAALAVSLALPLGGCANVGDSFASPAFVDPAKYELFDCERLKGERASLAAQLTTQQALIDKARTGAGGSVIGEAVYRGDFIKMQAQAKAADGAWRSNNCDAVTPPAPAPVAPPSPSAKRAR